MRIALVIMAAALTSSLPVQAQLLRAVVGYPYNEGFNAPSTPGAYSTGILGASASCTLVALCPVGEVGVYASTSMSFSCPQDQVYDVATDSIQQQTTRVGVTASGSALDLNNALVRGTATSNSTCLLGASTVNGNYTAVCGLKVISGGGGGGGYPEPIDPCYYGPEGVPGEICPPDVSVKRSSMSQTSTIGVTFLRADDPGFHARIGDQAAASLSTKPLSGLRRDVAVLSNESTRTVVAYVVRWFLRTPFGTSDNTYSAYTEPMILSSHQAHEGGTGIAPGAARVLHPAFNLTTKEFADIVNDPRMIHINDQRAEVTGAELDGILYDDGTFYGPDNGNFFLKFQAQLNARHDVGLRVLALSQSAKPDTEIIAELERMAADGQSYSANTSHDLYYSELGNEASQLLSVYKQLGRAALLNNAKFQSSEAKHTLIK